MYVVRDALLTGDVAMQRDGLGGCVAQQNLPGGFFHFFPPSTPRAQPLLPCRVPLAPSRRTKAFPIVRRSVLRVASFIGFTNIEVWSVKQ
jgi:hypothetical protein